MIELSVNQYTQKAQEALRDAQNAALERGNQQLEQVHLLSGLLENSDGLISQLLEKCGAHASALRADCLQALDRLPKVHFSSGSGERLYASAPAQKCLTAAMKAAESMKDEYISVEHLFMALMDTADETVSPLLRRYEIEKERFMKALGEVRGSARVTGDSPEDTYDALAKYGSDLVELAKKAAGDRALVAGDISSTGGMLYPLGDMSFEDFYGVYYEQAAALEHSGVDLFIIETMTSVPEARAALLAVKAVSQKPVFVSFTCDETGKTMMGTDVCAALLIMQGMGADAFGLNCSAGPKG